MYDGNDGKSGNSGNDGKNSVKVLTHDGKIVGNDYGNDGRMVKTVFHCLPL